MSEPVRVCVVTPFGTTDGGAELWLLDLLRDALTQEHGFEAHVVLLADGPLRAELTRMGIPTHVMNTGASPLSVALR
ncbi:hypothetical protein, partial [Salmonella sp. SAL4431]|uniref:hypothetical protein n=1 Tax=Salmonella sp. SAL4431 TaxID=3159886 RepID=UPI00397AFF8F